MTISTSYAMIMYSLQKIDVNILVVPQSQWKTDLRHANLSTCTTSISAGFVR